MGYFIWRNFGKLQIYQGPGLSWDSLYFIKHCGIKSDFVNLVFLLWINIKWFLVASSWNMSKNCYHLKQWILSFRLIFNITAMNFSCVQVPLLRFFSCYWIFYYIPGYNIYIYIYILFFFLIAFLLLINYYELWWSGISSWKAVHKEHSVSGV